MNTKMVGKYLGHLIVAEAVFLLPAVVAALWYGEGAATGALLASAGVCLLLGGGLWLACRGASGSIYAREGFVVAGAGWILISALGALPFFLSGEIPHYADAFFEAVSGFTTTGASILPQVEALSHGLVFWRSFTHWLGGIGVLAFILAIVRSKAGSGFSIHLFRAESPGPQVDKIMPKMRHSVQGLFMVYGGLSAINLVFLLAGGMPLFEALCTMFGTAGTGGFGIKNDSMASYSPYLQMVTAVFMALFGVNFTLYFMALRRQWRAALRDEELHLYGGIVLFAVGSITLSLLRSGMALGEGLRHSFFTVSSIITTTGYTTIDYDLWPQYARALLLVLMMVGAMAGSTGGGFKVARILILFKSMRVGIHRLLHPRSVRRVQLNGKSLDEDVTARTYLFLAVYCTILLVSLLLVSVDGFSLETNLSAVLSCVNNIGPGLGAVGPSAHFGAYSVFSKVVLSLGMLLGRLEIFPVLLLFSPDTWRKKG